MRRGLAAISILALFGGSACSWETPDFSFDARILQTAQSSRVYDRNGTLITELRGEQGRTDVTHIGLIPEVVRNAVVAIEDERFYEHDGIDLKAILRAARSNVSDGGIGQGGSTITQQYVGNVFLDRSEQTVTRKMREAFMARRFEQFFTKDFILLHYLNWVYFGNGAYGIEAASRQYFGAPACELADTAAGGGTSASREPAAVGGVGAGAGTGAGTGGGAADEPGAGAGTGVGAGPGADTSAVGGPGAGAGGGALAELGAGVCLKVSELTLEQAALLAGLIQRPSAFDPYRNPQDARRRRNLVLERMLANRYITEDEYIQAHDEPIALVEDVPILEVRYPAAHFVEDVKQWFLGNPAFGPTRDIRTRLLFEGGLDIHTTIDLELQAKAEAAVEAILPDNGENPDAAATVLGVGGSQDGQVLAMVGGRDFFGSDEDAKFNLASGKGRQAGSAMKPIALATALTQGYSVTETYEAPPALPVPPACLSEDNEPEDNEPEEDNEEPPQIPETPSSTCVEVCERVEDSDELLPETCNWEVSSQPVCGPAWKVRGGKELEDGSERKMPAEVDLETATTNSINTVYAQLIVEIRPANFVTMAERLGLRPGRIAPVCAGVLGTEDVNTLELANMFSTFARSGRRVEPITVTSILRPDGTELYAPDYDPVPVLDPSVADEITRVMVGTITGGTGRAADIGRPAAGKTGTAQNYADATFVGYTPQRAAAVWVGFPDAQIPMVPPDTDIKVTGGSYPARIWREIMAAAHEGLEAVDFPAPSNEPEPTEEPQVDLVEVPNLVGRHIDDRQLSLQLQEMGLTLASAKVHTTEFPEGTILKQAPAAGATLSPGLTINVEVATAEELPPAVMPDVIDLSGDEARGVLISAGLGVEVLVEPYFDEDAQQFSVEPGVVWSQHPAPGTPITVGGSATIRVNPEQ